MQIIKIHYKMVFYVTIFQKKAENKTQLDDKTTFINDLKI